MTEDDTNVAKSSDFFLCKICDYKTYRQSNYDKHLLTAKHKKSYAELQKVADIEESNLTYKCECGNEYIHRQSLYNHKKKCTKNENNINNKDDIIMMLIKQNSE